VKIKMAADGELVPNFEALLLFL